MTHTYEELKHKTLADLREIAKEAEVQGYTQLNKEHLLPVLCKALNIETHAHHEVVGLDKAKVKGTIQELKSKRSEVLAAGDHAELKKVRRRIHRLKRRIRAATV